MEIISLIFVFLLGSIIGSFVNVVALRYKTGLSISKGRSKCFSCSKTLTWKELIPILSFIKQRGKCRNCNSKISWQYPIVEFVMGVVFVLVLERQYSLWGIYSSLSNGYLYTFGFFVFYCSVFSLLMAIVIYDIRHKIIPDVFVYLFIVLSLIKLFLFFILRATLAPQINLIDILDLTSPILLFAPFALLWVVSGGRWIGFGDAKLAFGIGAMLGFVSGLSAIVLSFWIGAVYGILMILRGRFSIDSRKKITMSSEVPFAPFMILATLIIFLTRMDLLNIGSLLNLLN
jgi:prepilin signal peptidase PulO-like enzyme (type II secretory pathway)